MTDWDLNAKVAEAFGWIEVERSPYGDWYGVPPRDYRYGDERDYEHIPDYSGKDWQLAAEELRRRGWLVTVKMMPDGHEFLLGDCWVCDDKIKAKYAVEIDWVDISTPEGCRKKLYQHFWATGNELGVAVCRVALRAMDAEHA